MADIVEEKVGVAELPGGYLEIIHRQVHAGGIDMSAKLVLERTSAAWLAGKLREGIVGWLPREELELGRDSFTLFIGGSDWQPFIHVHNLRSPGSAHAGQYCIILTLGAGGELAGKLGGS
jgi:hypothetical protein